MKKFLAILLIAIVACETVEEISLKNFIDVVIDTLKSLGIYDQLISSGKQYAIKLCSNYIDAGLCEIAINWLFNELGLK